MALHKTRNFGIPVRFWVLTLIILIGSIANAAPSGNFHTTTRYFSASGKYLGSEKTYSNKISKRSYFYDSKGKYQGQSVKPRR